MSHLIRTALECVFFYKTNQQFKVGQFHLIEFRTNLFLKRKNCSTVYMLCLRRVVRANTWVLSVFFTIASLVFGIFWLHCHHVVGKWTMRNLLAVQGFLLLVFLVQLQRVVSRSSRKLVLPEITKAWYGKNIKVKSLKLGRKESRDISDVSVKPTKRLQEDFSCDCSNFCPDPDSSELEVSRDAKFDSRWPSFSGISTSKKLTAKPVVDLK